MKKNKFIFLALLLIVPLVWNGCNSLMPPGPDGQTLVSDNLGGWTGYKGNVPYEGDRPVAYYYTGTPNNYVGWDTLESPQLPILLGAIFNLSIRIDEPNFTMFDSIGFHTMDGDTFMASSWATDDNGNYLRWILTKNDGQYIYAPYQGATPFYLAITYPDSADWKSTVSNFALFNATNEAKVPLEAGSNVYLHLFGPDGQQIWDTLGVAVTFTYASPSVAVDSQQLVWGGYKPGTDTYYIDFRVDQYGHIVQVPNSGDLWDWIVINGP